MTLVLAVAVAVAVAVACAELFDVLPVEFDALPLVLRARFVDVSRKISIRSV